MSLERKIRELDVSLIVAPNAYFDGFSSAKHQAATLAAEADELMREMADTLMWVRDCDTNDKEEVLNLHKTVRS